MNLIIHDVINCLNKELDHTFCSLLRLCQFIDYIWKNHAENVHQKLVPDGILPKTAIAYKKFF